MTRARRARLLRRGGWTLVALLFVLLPAIGAYEHRRTERAVVDHVAAMRARIEKLESEVYLLRVVPVGDGMVLPQGLETPDARLLPFGQAQRF